MNRKKILFYVCIFFSLCSIAEDNENTKNVILRKDSVNNILKNIGHDTSRCALLSKLVEALPDGEWEEYNTQLKYLAEKNLNKAHLNKIEESAFKLFLAEAIQNEGVSFHNRGDHIKALACYEKALVAYEQSSDKKGLAQCLNNLGDLQAGLGNLSKALNYHQRSLKISEEINDRSGIASSLNYISVLYQNQGYFDIPKALEYQFRSLAIRKEINDEGGIANSLNNIGGMYSEIGDNQKGIDYLLQSLKVYEKMGNKREIGYTLNNIGSFYHFQKDAELALYYYKKSLAAHTEAGNKDGVASTLIGIGNIYQNKNDLLNALKSYEASLKIGIELGSKFRVSQALNYIGSVYYSEERIAEALDNFTQCLKLNEEMGNVKALSYTCKSIAECYIKKKDLKTALNFALRSMEYSKESDHILNRIESALVLKTIYEQTKQYDKALAMYSFYVQMRDSVNNENTRKILLKKQLDYEYQKKEDALKEKQIQMQELYAQKRKYYLVVTAVSVLLIGALGFLLYSRFKFKKEEEKNNLLIQLKDAEIKALQSQINPHFIFNSISSALVFIQTGQKDLALDYLTKFSRLIRFVLNGSENKMVSLENEISFISLYVELEQLRFNNAFQFELSVEPNVEIDNTEIPFMIIQPFIENAISHGLLNKIHMMKEASKGYHALLKINFSLANEKLLCVVSDNGAGRDKAMEIKQKFFSKNSSLGIKITNQRIELLSNKECRVSYEDLFDEQGPAGTKVKIELPILNAY